MFEFNINDYVYIRLTDEGCQYLADRHREFYEMHSLHDDSPQMSKPEYYKEKAEDGWSKFQMHDLISRFGDGCGVGCKLKFYIGVRFLKKDMKDV